MKIEVEIWYLKSHRGRPIEFFKRDVHLTDAGLITIRIAGGHGGEPDPCEPCAERRLFAEESLKQSRVPHEWGENGNVLFFPQTGAQTKDEVVAFLQRAFPLITEVKVLGEQG